jgi:hypothetical protein
MRLLPSQRVNDGAAADLWVGLGVNSGTVVVGTIGGGGRLDFTVIGDTVNPAARGGVRDAEERRRPSDHRRDPQRALSQAAERDDGMTIERR